MLELNPPVYGPADGTWGHSPTVDSVFVAGPPSATYKLPSGPNASPRGLFNPDANTVTFADGGAAPATGAVISTAAASRNATAIRGLADLTTAERAPRGGLAPRRSR
jgi:hypothetical protein